MTWHYNLNGTAVGPVSGEELLSLYGKGTVDEATLVWDSAEGGEWRKYGDVQAFRSTDAPPPLPTVAVSDACVWTIVSIPVIGGLAELIIAESFGIATSGWGFLVCYVVIYGLLAWQDERIIADSGRRVGSGAIWVWGALLVPVYLFLRAKRLGKTQITLGWWVASFAAGIYITEGPLASQMYFGAGIPPCQSQASVAQVESIFQQMTLNLYDIQAIDVRDIETSSSTSARNVCTANVLAADGVEYPVVYTIEQEGDQFLFRLNLR